MLVLVGPGVSANAIAINEDVGVHTKMPLNVRNRVVSPTGIAERTASLEIRLLPVARPAADLSQPCAPPVGLSLATRGRGVSWCEVPQPSRADRTQAARRV